MVKQMLLRTSYLLGGCRCRSSDDTSGTRWVRERSERCVLGVTGAKPPVCVSSKCIMCRQTLGGGRAWLRGAFSFCSLYFLCFALCGFFLGGQTRTQGSVTQGSGLAWVRRSDPARLGGAEGRPAVDRGSAVCLIGVCWRCGWSFFSRLQVHGWAVCCLPCVSYVGMSKQYVCAGQAQEGREGKRRVQTDISARSRSRSR